MILAFLSLALAQEGNWFESAFFGSGCTVQTYPGSPSGRLVDDALATNAALYSATATVDEIVLPGLARVAEANGGKGTVVVVRVDNLFSVQNVPARTFDQTTAGNGCSAPLLNAPVDLMSNRLATAHQHGIWGLFYGVSVNG